jgi:outer membrane protein assembly factor BamB
MNVMRATIVALIGCCLLHNATLAADWPEFRGPTRDGLADVKTAPLEWSETKNIAWKMPLAGEGWSSPVVVKDRVYLTAAIPVPNTSPTNYWLSAACIDAKTGEGVWIKNLFAEDGEKAPKIHSKNSHASPTPIVEGDRLYVHFGHMGTACLDLNGKVLWSNDKVKYDPVHGNGGSPVIVGKALIFSCDGAANPIVAALDKTNGKPGWSTPRPNDPPKKFAFCTPTVIDVSGKTQVVVPGAGCICSYDPVTGEEIWRVNHDGYSVIPRPIYAHGLVYVSTSYDSPVVMAIRPDGHGDVTDTHVAWSVKKAAPHTPSMLVIGDELYMVSDRGVAACVDAKTGEEIWQERLGGNYSASPVYAAGRIYFQDEDGTAHVIAAGREFKKLAENKLPERTLASYAVTEGAIFLRGDKHLYRIEEAK